MKWHNLTGWFIAELERLLLPFAHNMFRLLKRTFAPGETPELIRTLADANQNLATLRKRFDIQFDYSEHSLAVLDDVISKCWSAPPKKLDTMVAMFGSYLGETIRRQLGGLWAEDEVGYHLINVGGVDTRVDPFSKMRKRFHNGSGDSLSAYFTTIKTVTEEVLKRQKDS